MVRQSVLFARIKAFQLPLQIGIHILATLIIFILLAHIFEGTLQVSNVQAKTSLFACNFPKMLVLVIAVMI